MQLDQLPDSTRETFLLLSKAPELKEAILLGGTALTIQLGHRVSEDLDFVFLFDTLPTKKLEALIAGIKRTGLSVSSTLATARITQARINGYHLTDYVQEYYLNNTRVQFFVIQKGGQSRKNWLKQTKTFRDNTTFSLLSVDDLFKTKAVVLKDRATSRDLFDLMYLMNHKSYTVADIVKAIKEVDQVSANDAIEVLTGNIPLREDDPGLSTINENITIEEMYAFFTEKVNEYEVARTKDLSGSS